jgi:hypothetical protein
MHEITGIWDFLNIFVCLLCQWWSTCSCFRHCRLVQHNVNCAFSWCLCNVQKNRSDIQESHEQKKLVKGNQRKTQCHFKNSRCHLHLHI